MNALAPIDAIPFEQVTPGLPCSGAGGEMDRLYAALDRVSWAQNPHRR